MLIMQWCAFYLLIFTWLYVYILYDLMSICSLTIDIAIWYFCCMHWSSLNRKLKFNLKLRRMEGEIVCHVLHCGFLTGRQFDSPLSLSPIMQSRVWWGPGTFRDTLFYSQISLTRPYPVRLVSMHVFVRSIWWSPCAALTVSSVTNLHQWPWCTGSGQSSFSLSVCVFE